MELKQENVNTNLWLLQRMQKVKPGRVWVAVVLVLMAGQEVNRQAPHEMMGQKDRLEREKASGVQIERTGVALMGQKDRWA